MDLYRRIAALDSRSDADELLDELLDRFGPPPAPVSALLEVALLRSAAAREGICDITQRGRQLVFSFTPAVDVPSVMAVCTMAAWRSRLLLSAGEKPRLTLHLKPQEQPLPCAGKLLEDLRLKREELAALPAAPTETIQK